MAYVKNIWVDQDVERPKTYEVTNNQDGSITLTDSFGLVTELGTPVNEVNMNHIEDGIAGCAIRKHNLTETFNLGEWVLGGTGDDEGIYKSLVANNVGNAITDDTKWEKVEMGGGTRNIGEIVASTIPLTDAGLHLLDGALISGSGSYSAFVDYIADLYDSGDYTAIFETEANWQAAVTQYGVCGKFVYDSVNNTVRLPKYGNQILTSIPNTIPVKGNGYGILFNDGTNDVYLDSSYSGNQRFATTYIPNSVPAATGSAVSSAGNSTVGRVLGLTTDGSKSGLVTDVTNLPLNCYYYIVVATSAKTDIQVDIDEIATDLNGKADVDLTNTTPSSSFASTLNTAGIRTVVETYVSGTSWYRVYSDNWCEQGGYNSSRSANTTSITFLKPYANSNYNVTTTTGDSAGGNAYAAMVYDFNTTGFTYYLTTSCDKCWWRAEGYIS